MPPSVAEIATDDVADVADVAALLVQLRDSEVNVEDSVGANVIE